MREIKDSVRALVRVGYDGRVHKTFRGTGAKDRWANEIRVLRYLEKRGCDFVPLLLDSDEESLQIVTSNCGQPVEKMSKEKMESIFEKLEEFGVKHDDPFVRNITYNHREGRFFVIDFELAEIIGPDEDVPAPELEAGRTLRLEWKADCHLGRFRKENQDACFAFAYGENVEVNLPLEGSFDLAGRQAVFAVSDGMGGENGGEVASRTVVEKVTEQIQIAQESGITDTSGVLIFAVENVCRILNEMAIRDPSLHNMGATLSLCWFREDRVMFAHVGDSRIYLFRGGELRQVTHDHTLPGRLFRAGEINEREARTHPHRNLLNKAVGAGLQTIEPQIGSFDLRAGDVILICSDGLTGGLWDKGIREILARHFGPPSIDRRVMLHKAEDELLQKSLRVSGRDNTTLYVIAVSEVDASG